MPGREMARHVGEPFRSGALEGEDRLLLVADRKNAARLRLAHPFASRELGDQRADDLPLRRAGILRLVDQHMIDAEIELVMHPGRLDVGEQSQAFCDQVVVIEQAAGLLVAAIAADDRFRDRERRRGAIAGEHRAALQHQRFEPRLLGIQPPGKPAMLRGESPGDDPSAPLAFGGEEHREIDLRSCRGGQARGRPQPRGLLALARRSRGQERGDGMPFRNRQVRALRHRQLDAFQRFGRRHAERRRKLGDRRFDAAGALDPGDQRVALVDQVFDSGAERLVGARRDRGRERPPERALRHPGRFEQHFEAQASEEVTLRKLLQHRKARRHVGLERKLMEQPGAERMDGLHLETAGGLQRLREQSAGLGAAR